MREEYRVKGKFTAYHWQPDLDRIAELEARIDAVKVCRLYSVQRVGGNIWIEESGVGDGEYMLTVDVLKALEVSDD